ncbi:MAG: trypsin-like serine protease [Firmicutes bacterium]|nr:trypsin-like serine protease [Bacillota bacterium]
MKRDWRLSWPWIFMLLAVVFLGGLLVGPSIRQALFPSTAAAAKVYDRDTIADVAEKAAPAVVGITAYTSAARRTLTPEEEEFFRFFGLTPPRDEETIRRSFGTGFIFRPEGYILTNAHVVQNANKVEVTLYKERNPIPAEVVGRSNILDLAILKIKTDKPLPTLPLGDSDKLRPGEWVVASGNPLGYDHSVTAGVISALDRRVQAGDDQGGATRDYEELLQTDAAINPGNSGGPLLNLDGQVIGINAVVSTVGQGIGFAIPINVARKALDQLMTTGHYSRPWLGIRGLDLALVDAATRQKYRLPEGDGVFIAFVYPDAPADKAGLVPGDAILAIDGKPIRGMEELAETIRGRKVGDWIKVKTIHRGKEIDFELQLAEQPDE